jgi:HD-GYP domain-containing protein (c-di-GMP phosphodiesterase class II)
VTAASPSPVADDALIEFSRSAESSALARRDFTGLVAAAFVFVAVAALFLPAQRDLSAAAVLVTVVCYALSSRVRFEFGGVFAVPTQPVFVAMWFLAPPRLIPLMIVAAVLLSELPDIVRGRMPLERLPLTIASCWFSIGPALVVFLFAPHEPEWRAVPIFAAALLAQFVFDYLSQFLLARAVIGISPWEQLRGVLPAFANDALLWPLGLLVGFAAAPHAAVVLLVLPVLLMFSTFAKERQHRLDNALELSTAYRGTAILLGDVIEADDAYTGSHSRHVVDLVLGVADRLGLDTAQRRRAEFAALLHDVGKVKIPPEIINKPGALDDREWAVMRTHTILGEQMLEQIGGLLGEVGNIVRSCHERWDGTGYPDRLAGEAIPLEARIVCACDAWSAMTTDRSYRKARTNAEALAELRASSGSHFDPRVVAALEASLAS